MDINKLELLCDIANTNNLTQSAERMGYTQSGVSHAISKLETELGVTIFRRLKHGVELTADGELLLPYIRMVVTHYTRMNEVVDSIIGLQRGSICIGSYCSVAAQWLPRVIKTFQEAYPNIELKVREGGVDEVETWLLEGSIDLGFLSWREHPCYKFISLARDPLYAITSNDCLLPEEYRESFPIQAFSDYPFIAAENGVDHDVCNALDYAGVTPLTAFTCRDDHTIIRMVENNLGISFLPGLFLAGQDQKIRKIPVTPCTMRTLGIGILSEKTLTASTKAFIKIARDVISAPEGRS